MCKYYREQSLFTLPLEPFKLNGSMTDMFIGQSLHTDKEQHKGLLDFFNWSSTSSSRQLLLVGEHGVGKTTAIKRSAYLWCQEVEQTNRWNELKPKLILIFDLQKACSRNWESHGGQITGDDILHMNGIKVDEIVDEGRKDVLMVFDGISDFSRKCPELFKEVKGTIKKIAMKNMNFVVSTQTINSKIILEETTKRFETVFVEKFDKRKRSKLIKSIGSKTCLLYTSDAADE